ncbi:radical SAM protein [Sorangium sp. So ce117]|uniref:radical SAM protein n=1 Tax=Sorangium sp. So ce117 TaxID=3133277 RepID=UPI003F641C54
MSHALTPSTQTAAPEILLHVPKPGEALSIILKLPGDVCNINCAYCYEKRKPTSDDFAITRELLRTLFAKAEGRPLSIELHGGEPLLVGRERMRGLLRECRAYTGKLRIAIQTNAILVDQGWIDLFLEEWPEIEFGVSIDGDAAQNAHRVDYKNRSTHAEVERALALFHEANIKVGAIATVTRGNCGDPRRLLEYFLNLPAVTFLKLNPCFDFQVAASSRVNARSLAVLDPSGRGVPAWGLTPLEFRDFLCVFYDHWVEAKAFKRLLVEPFLSILRVLGGKRSKFCVYDHRKCTSVITLYPDGRLGSCDELSMPDALLARSIDEIEDLDHLVDLRTNAPLRADLEALLSKCAGCAYRTTCNGGCLATRKRYSGSRYYDEYCEYRGGVIEHIARRLGARAS